MIYSRTFLAIILVYTSLAEEGHNHGHGHGDHESDIFCVTECVDGNADPCGDGKGQQESCVADTSFMTNLTLFKYTDQTYLPKGFLGCSLHACEDLCMSVMMGMNSTSTDPMKIVIDDDGVKTFCFPHRESDDGKFATKDLAEMSALSRGCSGSHFMDPIYMHGSNHGVCDETYDPESASSRFTWCKIVVAVALSTTTLMVI